MKKRVIAIIILLCAGTAVAQLSGPDQKGNRKLLRKSVITAAPPTKLSSGTLILDNVNSIFTVTLTGNFGTIAMQCPTDQTMVSQIKLNVIQDSSGVHPVLWDDNGVSGCPIIFYAGAPGSTTDDQPYYNANSSSTWQFDFWPSDHSWHRTSRSTMEGANLAGAGYNVGPHSPPGNLAFFYNTPALNLNAGQCIQVSGDNAGNPQGAANYIYYVWAASQICNNGTTAGWMSFKSAITTNPGPISSPTPGVFGTDLPMSEPIRVQPNQCIWVQANMETQIGSPAQNGTQVWGQDSSCVEVSQAGFNVTMTSYINESVGSF